MAVNLNRPELLKSQIYSGGQWCDASSTNTYAVANPADGALIANVAQADAVDAQQAIEHAQEAFAGYAALTAKQRSDLLRAWFELIKANSEDLACLITAEMGKPLAEARGEVAFAAAFVEWFAEEARRAYGDIIPGHQPDKRILAVKQPIGVCAAITPWNFPAAMITRKVAPGLAVGCPIVVKPAGQTPFTALALAQLAHEAGFPPGVFNVLPSNLASNIGSALTSSESVRKFSFTGSTSIGRKLYEQCAHDIKKMSLELGGNAPFIVFDDADIAAAADGAMICKFRNTGQTCVCANRIYVQENVYDEFADALAERVRKLKVGNGMDADVSQGPLINEAGLAKVEEHVADALSAGAQVVCGAAKHSLGGLFYEPTVLKNVTQQMLICSEETFGPVAPLIKFADEQQAISWANDSPVGLSAYFYTQNLARAHRVAERIEAGMVGVNTGLISNEAAPFGGIKQSGLGREGSKYGIEEYLEIKYICLGGIE